MKSNLKPCPDCGHHGSKEAAACSGCGRKLNQVLALWMILGFTIGGVGMAIVLAIVFLMMNL